MCLWRLRRPNLQRMGGILLLLLQPLICAGSQSRGVLDAPRNVTGHPSSARLLSITFQNSTLPAGSSQAPATALPAPTQPEDPVMKGVAEGGLAIVSLGFAAFTFLYGALIGLSGTGDRVKTLKTKLRRALYATVFAVVSAAVLSVLAYISIEWKLRWVGDVAVALALIVLLVLSGVAVYMAVDVYRERAQ